MRSVSAASCSIAGGVAAAAALWAGAAAAQEHDLGRTVVTATRQHDDALSVPAAVDVVDAGELRLAQPMLDLAESLQRVPGVVVRDRHNAAQDLQISIRGFGARATFGVRGVRLYTDGIPATMPDGQGQVSHFSLQSAQRIEVLRGPYSALYGNAAGGVIAVYSATGVEAARAGAGGVAGPHGLRRLTASLRAPVADGGLRVELEDADSDGFREHSAYRRRGGQALLNGALGGHTRFTLLFNGLDLDARDPQGLDAAQLARDRRAASAGALAFDNRKQVRQDQFGARVQRAFGARHSLAATAWRGQRRTAQVLSIPVSVQADPRHGGGVIDLDRGYHGVDLRWQWSLPRLTLTAGLQHERSAERRRGFENFVGGTLGVTGALRRDEDNRVTGDDRYLQLDWRPAERWRVNLGLRDSRVAFRSEDRYVNAANPDDSGRLAFSRVSPVAGASYRVRPWLSAFVNAGRGFETPTFAELAYRPDGASGLNDALRPATSRSVEAGLRARRRGFDAGLALFATDTDDELRVASSGGGRSVYTNAAHSRRRGLEWSLAVRPAPGWRVASAYTLLDARYGDGRRIPGLARHTAWASLVHSPRADLDLVLEGRFVDRVFVDDDNAEAAPAYARFDAAVERRFASGRVFVRVNNLLDRAYIGSVIVNEGNGRYYEPAPGRTWLLGLDWWLTKEE